MSNENDKDTFATYDYNFPKTKHIKDSIKNLKGSILEDGFDGIIGGPPCQSWSEAGKQKGINDPRGRLFYEYVRILKIVKPRFFLAENVSGMLHKKHSNALKNITDQFKENGYNINFQLVDAVNFGVPQNRKRVFIVGVKKELETSFTFPSSKLFENPKTVLSIIGPDQKDFSNLNL